MTKKQKNKRPVFKWLVATLCMLTLLAAAGLWYVYRTGLRHTVVIDREEYPVIGVDISAHNGVVDFAAMHADSVLFVYLKATEGASFKDQTFERNCNAACAVSGLAVGAYHFFRFDVNGTLQAKNFLAAIAGRNLTMPPVIDVEEHGNPDTGTDVVVARLQEMVAALENAGYQPMIYTNMNGYRRFYREDFDNCPLWISRFTAPPEDMDWTIWQYSHWGEVPGAKGDVDLNVFSGSRADFLHWLQ